MKEHSISIYHNLLNCTFCFLDLITTRSWLKTTENLFKTEKFPILLGRLVKLMLITVSHLIFWLGFIPKSNNAGMEIGIGLTDASSVVNFCLVLKKFCTRAKWPIRPELNPVSLA